MITEKDFELTYDNAERVALLVSRIKTLNNICGSYLYHSCDLYGNEDERVNARCLIANVSNMNELNCVICETTLEIEELLEGIVDILGTLSFAKARLEDNCAELKRGGADA